MYYWRPDNRREIDFVLGLPSGDVTPLEVKYQQNVGEHDARHVIAAGGGLVATRTQEGDLADGDVYAIPTAELLVLLDTPSLAPCRS